MASKLILIADPGIDGAFAITLGLLDPDLDILGLAASGERAGGAGDAEHADCGGSGRSAAAAAHRRRVARRI